MRDLRGQRRRKRVRWAAAIAVSLAVHVALVLVPVGEERPPRREEPIELEVRYFEPEASERASGETPPRVSASAETSGRPVTSAAAAERPARAGVRTSAESSAAPDVHASAESPAVPAAHASAESSAVPDAHASAESPAVPAAHASAETEPVPVTPPTPGTPERPDDGVRREAPLALEPRLHLLAPPPEEIPAPREKTPEEKLSGLFADDRAIRRATEAPDSYWSGLRHKLEDGWTVSRDQLRDGPRTGLGIRVDKALDDYLAEASAYGNTGTPYGDGPWVPGGRALSDRGIPVDAKRPPPTLDTNGENSTYSTTREALVLVVQGDDGRILDVRLHRSSGHPGYDRAALARAKALADSSLDAPPKDGRTSLWSFDAKLVVTPPLPIAGCAVDAYFIPQHCFYPLSERTKQAVRLLAVWGPGEEPGLR